MTSIRFVSVVIGLVLTILSANFTVVAEILIYCIGFVVMADFFLDLLLADLKKISKVQRLRRQSQGDCYLQDRVDSLNDGTDKH